VTKKAELVVLHQLEVDQLEVELNLHIQLHLLKLKKNLKFSLKSMKMMNGLQFRNSILFFITRNKNKHCFVTQRESVSSRKSFRNKLKPKTHAPELKDKKIIYMTNFSKSMENFWILGKKRKMNSTEIKLWVIKKPEMHSLKKKREEKDARKRSNKSKKLNTFRDCKMKWMLKEICKWKKEDKSVSIFRECYKKMKIIKEDRKKRMKNKDSTILKPKKIIPKCLINKKQIASQKWSKESKEPKNSWIKWPIMCSVRWNRDKKWKNKCLQDTKMKKKCIKDKWMTEEFKRKKMNKQIWEIIWLNKWPRSKRERLMIKRTLINKLKCGLKIKLIGMKKRED